MEQITDTVLQLFYYGHSNTANHLIWLVAHMSQRGHAQDLYLVLLCTMARRVICYHH